MKFSENHSLFLEKYNKTIYLEKYNVTILVHLFKYACVSF